MPYSICHPLPRPFHRRFNDSLRNDTLVATVPFFFIQSIRNWRYQFLCKFSFLLFLFFVWRKMWTQSAFHQTDRQTAYRYKYYIVLLYVGGGGCGFLLYVVVVWEKVIYWLALWWWWWRSFTPTHHSTSLSGSFHITDRLNRRQERYTPQPKKERKKKKIGEFYRQGTSWIGWNSISSAAAPTDRQKRNKYISKKGITHYYYYTMYYIYVLLWSCVDNKSSTNKTFLQMFSSGREKEKFF